MELDEVDRLFAKHWCPKGEGQHFLAHLFASARAGNLCWSPEVDMNVPAELVYEGDALYPDAPVVRSCTAYYLQRHWAAESEVVRHLTRLRQSGPSIPLSFAVEGVTEEQAAAVGAVLNRALTLITGGPGTGKTFTAAQLIRTVREVDPDHRIALAAPTGKAAGNLEGSLRKALGKATPEVTTLHRLIRRKQGRLVVEMPLAVDLLLVDEASMIDVEMMAALLSAVPEGARLILMGDAHQLPPVEAGGLFADMVGCCREAVVELSRCLRVETEGLVRVAEQVKRGVWDETIPIHPLSKERLIEQVASQFPSPFIDPAEAGPELLERFMKFRLLAPVRKGEMGIEGLNSLLHSHFRSQGKGEMYTPIMVRKNAYDLALYNGEMGLMGESHALFPSRTPDSPFHDSALGMRKIPLYALPPYELAYCLSVHKSQGSEFERVAFVLSPGSEQFGRELFYTALTRARRSFELFGEVDRVYEMIGKQAIRRSRIADRILRGHPNA